MGYLSDKEWRALDQLIFRINECNSYEKFSETVYKHLHPLVYYSKGLMFRIQENGEELSRFDPYTFSIASEKPLDTNLPSQNRLRTDEFLRAPWSSVFRESDMQDIQNIDNIQRYKTIWEPQNIHYGLHIALIYNDTPLGIMNFYRPKNHEDFSARDVFIAEIIMNHLALKLYSLRNVASCVPSGKLSDMSKYNLFTNRELEVIQLLGAGEGSSEICKRLFISESTLRKHIYNIFRKTGVKSRAQLIVWIKENCNL